MPGEKCRSARQYEYYNTKTIKKDGKKQKNRSNKKLEKNLKYLCEQYSGNTQMNGLFMI